MASVEQGTLLTCTTRIANVAWLAGLLALLWLGLAAPPAHAGTKHYYYTDAQGTVLAKTDAQGNIVARYDYKPYGAPMPGPQTLGPTGYTGHVNDTETGLVYMQVRYYDPVVGRFLSVDPVGLRAGNGLDFNRYAYANNNPIVNIDPDGRQAFTVLAPPPVFLTQQPLMPRVSPLTQAIRAGIRNPGPKPVDAVGRAAEILRQNGIDPRPNPRNLKPETREPWTPPELANHPLKDADSIIDLIKMVAQTIANLHGEVVVTAPTQNDGQTDGAPISPPTEPETNQEYSKMTPEFERCLRMNNCV